MFSPWIAKAQKKTGASSTSKLAPQRSTLVVRPFGGGAIEQVLMLQRTIGNQATLRLLLQHASSPAESERSDQREQAVEELIREAPVASWDVSKVPIALPDRVNRPQARSSLSASALPGVIQPKLAVGRVDDPFEHEADRVADQVIRMPAPGPAAGHGQVPGTGVQPACAACEASQDRDGEVLYKADASDLCEPFAVPLIRQRLGRSTLADAIAVQRDIGQDEIKEQLVTAFLSSEDTVQRQVAGQENDDDTTAGERILMQAKLEGPRPAQLGASLEEEIGCLEGRGDPLPSGVRDDMEGRFGHDFNRVRVHADASAARLARQVNARAFTIGRNVVFASGEYAPHGTTESRRLLAHELAHVIQQGQAEPRLQRKIAVAGKDYTPSATYLSWLNTNFGSAMKEFVKHMHNDGNPPVYSFSSFEQMGSEIRIRANAIKGIEDVHKGCCDYFDSAHPPYLDSAYWDQVSSGVRFKMKSPLPAGKHPSDAIQAIFAPGAGTRVECLSMTLAIEYYSMLKGLGAAKFDAQFAGGIEISAAPTSPLVIGPGKKYDIIAVASKSEILPGDWVYFKNFKDYTIRVPGGYWQGENAIYLGGGNYRGFGVPALSENDLNQELVKQYNTGATPHLSKTVADLIADGGGLLLSPVVRPIISKIAP